MYLAPSRIPGTAFVVLCGAAEITLLLFDRPNAYIALGASAYGLSLWLLTRALIPLDASERLAIKTNAKGWVLAARVMVVVSTLAVIASRQMWFWQSSVNKVLQIVSSAVGLPQSTALPNLLFYVLVPGVLLFLLGAKPLELGLVMWRKGGWYTLGAASILPLVSIGIWIFNGHATLNRLLQWTAHNFLSNGFSEEFLLRGITLSHLRAFLSSKSALVVQAIIFALLHLSGFNRPSNWALEAARVIAMTAPTGYFFGLLALRTRSVFLPGIIHTTYDTMNDLLGIG